MDNIISKDQNFITTDSGKLVFVPDSVTEDVCPLCDVFESPHFKSCAGLPCTDVERIDKKSGYYKYKADEIS